MSAEPQNDCCLVGRYWRDRIEECHKRSHAGCSETLLDSREEHARMELAEHLRRVHDTVASPVSEGDL